MNLYTNKNLTASQKILDTLGRPMRDLRISLTDRCNFNCNYCMPEKDIEFLPREEILSFEEIERFTRICVELGVRKVKLTGGEPTLRVGIDGLIQKLGKIKGLEDVGLITNGYFLKSIGHRLKSAGLKRISISLDALDERVFQKIVGDTHSVHPVLEGIETAVQLGFAPVKINCVIQRGINDNQILDLVEYFRHEHFHLRFIEFMDVGTIDWDKNRVVTSKEILDIIENRYPLEAEDPNYFGEVANMYNHADGKGKIGFISSVSMPFCRTCTRLRISANGILYGCLFTSEGVDIKELMRNETDDLVVKQAIADFWLKRDDRYSEIRQEQRNSSSVEAKPNMNFMGG